MLAQKNKMIEAQGKQLEELQKQLAVSIRMLSSVGVATTQIAETLKIPVEVVDKRDVDSIVDLVCEAIIGNKL